MANPFSAVAQKLSRRDSTSVLIALFLAYALVAFGIAAAATGAMRWLIGFTGAFSFAAGTLAFGYAFLLKPERLRTEETMRMDMMLAWLTRADVDDDHRSSAARLLPLVLEVKSGKNSGSQRKAERTDRD